MNLEIEEGELLVLLGPSGSGKTTVLRVVAGLEEPTSGTVWIGGRDVTRVPAAQRNVSMVFQGFALFPHLSVADNIGFGLRARRVERGVARAQVAAAAEIVGCANLLGRRPSELSGGERQRVALARALVREPELFLLDEPLSHLDAQLRVQMRSELRRLHERVGATTMYVTHDQMEGLMLGDRLAVLHGGALQQVGTPDEIYDRPANRFVATFVGTPPMNMLPVVDGRAGPFSVEAPLGRTVDAGIRPEHIVLGVGAPLPVQAVEAAGAETFIHLGWTGGTIVVRTGPGVRPRVGDAVPVSVNPAHVRLFDASTGVAL